jgi:hypothetical protein
MVLVNYFHFIGCFRNPFEPSYTLKKANDPKDGIKDGIKDGVKVA